MKKISPARAFPLLLLFLLRSPQLVPATAAEPREQVDAFDCHHRVKGREIYHEGDEMRDKGLILSWAVCSVRRCPRLRRASICAGGVSR